MPQAIGSYSVEERILDGGTAWVAIRARGAEWLFKPQAVPGPPYGVSLGPAAIAKRLGIARSSVYRALA